MRIDRVKAFIAEVVTAKPLVAGYKKKVLPGVIVCAEGLCGNGIGRVSTRRPDALMEQLSAGGQHLVGRDASHIRQIHADLAGVGVPQGARAIVDIALWDLAARRAEVPLWHLLGGGKPDGVATYLTAGWIELTLPELVSGVAGLAEDGWPAVKIKVGHPDPVCDVERLRAVRRAVGEGVELMADANRAWSHVQAAEFASAAADLRIAWLEEPVDDDAGGYAELARQVSVPIAAGENFAALDDVWRFACAGGASVLQPDATRIGGVTPWLDAAGVASAAQLAMVPHHSDYDQLHQHLALSAPAAQLIEAPWPIDAFAEPCAHRPGWLFAPVTPGASTEIAAEIPCHWWQ